MYPVDTKQSYNWLVWIRDHMEQSSKRMMKSWKAKKAHRHFISLRDFIPLFDDHSTRFLVLKLLLCKKNCTKLYKILISSGKFSTFKGNLKSRMETKYWQFWLSLLFYRWGNQNIKKFCIWGLTGSKLYSEHTSSWLQSLNSYCRAELMSNTLWQKMNI